MHSPLMMQLLAHLRDSSGPTPCRTMSRTPVTTSRGSALPIRAAAVLGQAVKQAPHLVQASSMSSTRLASALSNVMSLIAFAPRYPETCCAHFLKYSFFTQAVTLADLLCFDSARKD